MLAKTFGCSQSYVCKTLKRKTSIRYRKKIKKPKRLDSQKKAFRPKCLRLTKIFRNKKIIIDDESYFGLSNVQLSGNSGFYTSCVEETPDEVKSDERTKFEPKLLVWAAISAKGISKPYIVPSGQAINQEVYIDKCLRSRLLPFIEEFHKDDDIIFWPDLASSHYANTTLEFLRSKNIDFVPKCLNPANVPELRPIEDLWSELKRLVYDKCWKANNLKQLENRIRYAFKKINQERIHKLGSATFTRVDACRRHGLKNL
jgi:hypothetical protein